MSFSISTDTIFAPATAVSAAGVCVIRISGECAASVLQTLTLKPLPSPRVATLSRIFDPRSGELIDQALALFFPAPHSFTGEDVVELHTHGSRAVVKWILEMLGTFDSCRLAEPGEFSRRAFLHGKMDLVEAEGLADLIQAETSLQAKQALRQMQGELSTTFEQWRHQLIETLAYMEAYIDFPDEEIPPSVFSSLQLRISNLCIELRQLLSDQNRGERLRDGLHAIILGPPNAGKSSLLNTLAKRDVAIVSDIAGTTRDVIEVHLDINGYPFILHDTAGLRETSDILEQEGIRRALDKASSSELKIIVLDASLYPFDPALLRLIDKNSIVLINKIDLFSEISLFETPAFSVLPISIKENLGFDRFYAALNAFAEENIGNSAGNLLTRSRHRILVQQTLGSLEKFSPDFPIELSAEFLRLASRSLGELTGRISVDDVLDSLFSSFCIGK